MSNAVKKRITTKDNEMPGTTFHGISSTSFSESMSQLSSRCSHISAISRPNSEPRKAKRDEHKKTMGKMMAKSGIICAMF